MAIAPVTTNELLRAPRTLEVSPEAERLLTVHEVAELLRVAVSWVYEHTRPGCSNPLPHVKIGKYLRFFPADIFVYLSAMRAPNHRRR